MTPEERFERIEKNLDRMATESDIRMTRIETNLELFQDFIGEAFKRSEERLDRIESAILKLAEIFDRHASDGHGVKPEED